MLADIHLDLYGPEALAALFEHKDDVETAQVPKNSNPEVTLDDPPKKNRSRLGHLRRRRKRRSSGDSSDNDSEIKDGRNARSV
jgi:hypothetical protein